MKNYKKYLFILAMSSMLFPLFLSFLPINDAPFEVLKLENDYKVQKPVFPWANIFADSVTVKGTKGKDSLVINSLGLRDKLIENHTQGVEKNINQNFGLRPLYIRFRNQLDYSLFGKAHAKSVIVGKEGYLFEEQYIKSYYGQDFIGKDTIADQVSKLKFIQEELEKQGKLVMVVIAPGKGSFYPEHIPEKYVTDKTTTNYEQYVKEFNKNDINYIDFNKHLLMKKETSKHILYPKTGIHWSQYAMYHALDSMLNYIELKQDIDLLGFNLRDRKVGGDLQFKDNDIEKGLNLFFSLDHLPMSYPKFNYDVYNGETKPSILTISDSFYWQMYNLGISHQIFNDGKFWFYNQTIYPDTDDGNGEISTNSISLFEEIQKRDIILLMATEANMYRFSYGFIDEAHMTLKTGIENYNNRITEIIGQIKATPEWLQKIEAKSIEKGISLDEMLMIDAQYVYKMEIQKK